ncbi:MAG: leucine-rich repeat domain-containing protein, partial [Mediterranea sp.]|nr:leucine-rich repeat domain-containing protein [Mediterranea sp.]
DNAFVGCKYLQLINAQSKFTISKVGSHAFDGCEYLNLNLTNISLGKTSESKIMDYAFKGCRNITGTLKISCDIGEYAFENCEHIGGIELEEGIENIGAFSFRGMRMYGGGTLNLPSTLKKVGERAFVSLVSLNNIIINSNFQTDSYIFSSSFNGSLQIWKENVENETVLNLDKSLFSGNSLFSPDASVNEVNVYGKVKISSLAFIHNEKVKWHFWKNPIPHTFNYDIPDGKTYEIFIHTPFSAVPENFITTYNTNYDKSFFEKRDNKPNPDDYKGVKLKLHIDNPVIFADNSLGKALITDLYIMEDSKYVLDLLSNDNPITKSYSNQLNVHENLDGNKLILSINPIDEISNVPSWYIKNFYLSSNHKVDGLDNLPNLYRLINLPKVADLFDKFNDGGINVIVEEGVQSIERGCFQNVKTISTIKLPKSLIYIDRYAFSGASNVNNIRLPEGLVTIGYGAFAEWGNDKRISVPKSVKNIDKNAFAGNENLTIDFYWTNKNDIILVDNVYSDKDYTLTIVVPKGCRDIYDKVFNYDKSSGQAVDRCEIIERETEYEYDY